MARTPKLPDRYARAMALYRHATVAALERNQAD